MGITRLRICGSAWRALKSLITFQPLKQGDAGFLDAMRQTELGQRKFFPMYCT